MPIVDTGKKKIRLQVKSANLNDVGKNFCRISTENLQDLALNPGDLAEIIGKDGNKTTVVVWAALPEDEKKKIIRIDGTVRRNASAPLDEYVDVQKTEVIIAELVELTPTGKYNLRGAPEYFKNELNGAPISVGDILRIRAGNRMIEYSVNRIIPQSESGSVLVSEKTEIQVVVKKNKKDKDDNDRSIPKISYEDIGGLGNSVTNIREIVELPIRFPELFIKLGISPPKGLLMYGPPGTGKTLLARAVANETQSNFIYLSGADVFSKYAGEAEKKIRELFEDAKKKAPSIIFIDEIDAIAPKREDASETSSSLVAQLLSLMDGIESRGEVVVIAATNLPNSIDPALRRPGRFDRELEIGVPDRDARNEILTIHTRNMPLDKDVSLLTLADMSYGYVGADLASLCREAAFRSIRRFIPEINWDNPTDLPFKIEDINVTMGDFTSALFSIKPSAMREIFVEIPDVRMEEIGGLTEIKKKIKESVEWTIKFPDLFKHAGIKPPKGLLLFGSPGTGKTYLVKALASATRFNLISIKGSELLSKWVGESERAVREIFRKAKQVSPSIVFFDELDALSPTRQQDKSGDSSGASERVVSQLLAELDGLVELSDVFVIAATNRPDKVDSALLRPGRFDRLMYLHPPKPENLLEIFQIHTRNMPLSPNIILDELLQDLGPNPTGAQIELLCKEAGMQAIRRFMSKEVLNRFGTFTSVSRGAMKTLLAEEPFEIIEEDFKNAKKSVGTSYDETKMASYKFAQERKID
jgi:transitional endoplasmic reticulum ATPase